MFCSAAGEGRRDGGGEGRSVLFVLWVQGWGGRWLGGGWLAGWLAGVLSLGSVRREGEALLLNNQPKLTDGRGGRWVAGRGVVESGVGARCGGVRERRW